MRQPPRSNDAGKFSLPGHRVKLVLDKERSPDNHFHGRTGEITDIEFDDLGETTGKPEDSFIYTVKLDSGKTLDIHFRRHDLRGEETH